jgi:hypothetical protein
MEDLPDDGQTQPKHVADYNLTCIDPKVVFALTINALINRHKAITMPKISLLSQIQLRR